MPSTTMHRLVVAAAVLATAAAFAPLAANPSVRTARLARRAPSPGSRLHSLALRAAADDEAGSDEIIELFDAADDASTPPVPLTSTPAEVAQVEDTEEKQGRVILYIALSLAPILFLLPFLSGGGELVPLDAETMSTMTGLGV